MNINYWANMALAATDSTVCDPGNVGSKLCNPLTNLGVADIPGLLARILNDLGGIIGLIAIGMVVFAGFRMVTANGDKAIIDSAKNTLKYSIYGFVASVLAYAGVVAVENFIGVNDVNYDSYRPQNPLSQFSNLKQFAEQMIRNVLLIIGAVSMLMIIINGFKYMTARGNETQVEESRRALTWAVVGLGLSLFAYTIISAIARLIVK